MSARATISFDEDNFIYLEKHAGKNRSQFINQLIRDERQRQLEAWILRSSEEELADEECQAEIALWDVTVGDGINFDEDASL